MRESVRTPKLPWPRLAKALTIAAALPLTACVLESPYWAQTFNNTGSLIPIQAWVTDATRVVKIECSKAYHGGLYPAFGPATWVPVTTLTPSSQPSYDPKGNVVYSVGTKRALPAACWHADEAYSPPKYMAAIRATQLTASFGTLEFRVFDQAGLECLGRENGKQQSWFGWVEPNCQLNYSGSQNYLPWVKVIATSLGTAPLALTASQSEAAELSAKASLRPEGPSVEAMAKSFSAEPVDHAWASAMEQRLRSTFAEAAPGGSALASASCRHTMCQVDVRHGSEQDELAFIVALAPKGLYSGDGERGRRFVQKSAEGLQSVYYIARDQFTLPSGR